MGIDDEIKEDLIEFRDVVLDHDDTWADDYQEYLLVALSLILNQEFRGAIKHKRTEMGMRKEWHTTLTRQKNHSQLINEVFYWLNDNKRIPFTGLEPDFKEICYKFKLSPSRWGLYVAYCIYLDDFVLSQPDTTHHFHAHNEHKYKAHIDTGETADWWPTASIKLYQDTTKEKLINFIHDNWINIAKVQKDLPRYNHTRNINNFRLKLLIYLHRKLGKKATQIAELIQEEYEYKGIQRKDYILNENDIYRHVKVFRNRILEIQHLKQI